MAENNDMRNTRGTNPPPDFGNLGTNIGQLNTNLASFTREMRRFSDEFSRLSGTSSSGTASRSSNRTNRSARRTFDDFESNVSDLNDELAKIERELAKTQSQMRNISGTGAHIETAYAQRQKEILESYKKEIESIKEQKKLNDEANKQNARRIQEATASIEQTNREVEEEKKKKLEAKRKMRGATSGSDDERRYREEYDKHKKRQEELEQQAKRYSTVISGLETEARKRNEDIKEQSERAEQKRKESERSLEQEFSPILDIFTKSQEEFERAADKSSAIADFIKQNEESEAESFNKTMSGVKDSLQQAIDELTKKIKEEEKRIREDTSLTQEQKDKITEEIKNLEENRKIAEKQLKAAESATYNNNQARQVLSNAKDIFNNSLKNMINGLTKIATDKYFDAYLDAFDRVYASIEQTRNEVSARLRINQGEFSDLQEEIYAEIESQGLAGTISEIDINTALGNLVTAGVADEETLKALAIEQAKLTASGSTVSLTNEETLQRILSTMSQEMYNGATRDEALQKALKGFDYLSNVQAWIRETQGSDIALAAGGADQIVNAISNIDTALGRNSEMYKDAALAMSVANQLQAKHGIDANTLTEALKELSTGKLSEGSPIIQKLRMENLIPEEMKNMEMGEILEKIYNAYAEATSGSPNWATIKAGAYGVNLNEGDILRFNQIEENGGLTFTIDDYAVSKIAEGTDEALANGTWLSATAGWNKKAENAVTDSAITMEQMYEGDQAYHAVVGSIADGVKEIIGLLTTQLVSGFGGANTGILSGGGLSSSAWGASSTLGKVGSVAGVAAGIGLSGYSIYKNVEEYDGIDAAFETAKDPTFWTGAGTALGSAAGGPLGAAIGGAIGSGVGQIAKFSGSEKGIEIFEKSLEQGVLTQKLIEDNKIFESFMNSADALKDAANSLTESSENTYNTARKEYDRLSKLTTDEKKLELLKKDIIDEQGNIIDKDEIINGKDEYIQKLFEENVLQEQKNLMAKELAKHDVGSYVGEHSHNIQELKDQFEDFNVADVTVKDEVQRNKAITALGGVSAVGDLYSAVTASDTMTDDEIKLSLTDRFSIDELNNMDSETLRKEYQQKQLSTFKSTAGLTGAAAEWIDVLVEQVENNKSVYESANADFQSRWEKAKELADNPSSEDSILVAYIGEYGNQLEHGLKAPMIAHDADGNVILDPISDMYKEDYKGYFESGLTSVPYDDYPALLHRGERVLTKEESAAYNNLSSSIMEFMSNISDETLLNKLEKTLTDKELDKYNDLSSNITEYMSNIIGSISNNKKYEGYFETGLTDVPIDDYPTLLHRGERVLTKEEASAYNDLSSYMMESISNNATNSGFSTYMNNIDDSNYQQIFNSKTFGTDELNTSIKSQTGTIEGKLNEVISCLKVLIQSLSGSASKTSIANANLINMNSNATQLSTMF